MKRKMKVPFFSNEKSCKDSRSHNKHITTNTRHNKIKLWYHLWVRIYMHKNPSSTNFLHLQRRRILIIFNSRNLYMSTRGIRPTWISWETNCTKVEIDSKSTLCWSTNDAPRCWEQIIFCCKHFHSKYICLLPIQYAFNINSQDVTPNFHTLSGVLMGRRANPHK
jgi:hypothetical protein